jgi:hypothetical protein
VERKSATCEGGKSKINSPLDEVIFLSTSYSWINAGLTAGKLIGV